MHQLLPKEEYMDYIVLCKLLYIYNIGWDGMWGWWNSKDEIDKPKNMLTLIQSVSRGKLPLFSINKFFTHLT